MLTLISPAKTLDFESPYSDTQCTQPSLINHSEELMKQLKKLSVSDIQDLMNLSEKLAILNHARFQDWKLPLSQKNARPAIRAFKGDVYQGIDVDNLNKKETNYLQKHLRILSGLYGLLKPLDLMLAYRLEMGTHFQNKRGKNLYAFWKGYLTDFLKQELLNTKTDTIINLASNEYFKAVETKDLQSTLITPVFKDWSKGKYKIISFHAKKARGLMCRFMAQNNIKTTDTLKDFNLGGYAFCAKSSSEKEFVFLRDAA